MVGHILDYAETTRTTVIMVSDHATANPSFIGTQSKDGFNTLESHFSNHKFIYPNKESLDSLLSEIVIDWVDISKYRGESENSSYKGDHSGSDVPCFLYSKRYNLPKIIIKNTDILPIVKRQLGRSE